MFPLLKAVTILAVVAAVTALACMVTLIWTVPARASGVEIITSHHLVVLGTNLPSCPTENTGADCVWNIHPGDGLNGVGLAYWRHNGKVTYVWNHNPIHGDWTWVPGWARRTLRATGLSLSMSCKWRPKDYDWWRVVCANGQRWGVNY